MLWNIIMVTKMAIFSFGINRGGVERENIAISINAVKAIQFW